MRKTSPNAATTVSEDAGTHEAALLSIDSKGPNPVDIYVGQQVRHFRRRAGMSQSDLAVAIGITFQQVQKYEKGGNRISASKLHAIAGRLHVPLQVFFPAQAVSGGADGLPDPSPEPQMMDFLMTAEGRELACAFSSIRSGKLRQSIKALVRAVAADSDEPLATAH